MTGWRNPPRYLGLSVVGRPTNHRHTYRDGGSISRPSPEADLSGPVGENGDAYSLVCPESRANWFFPGPLSGGAQKSAQKLILSCLISQLLHVGPRKTPGQDDLDGEEVIDSVALS